MQRDHKEDPSSNQRKQHERVPSGWAKGSPGQADETLSAVCKSCWRCVERSAGPGGFRCPRCGTSLTPLGDSSSAPRQIASADHHRDRTVPKPRGAAT
jgi:hypothetical protein